MAEKFVNKGVWVEGLLLATLGVVGLAESIRLDLYTDPKMLRDWLGPGYYLLLMSLGLLATGIAYIYNHRTAHSAIREETGSEGRTRRIASFATCALYLVLIEVAGYVTATFVFFVLMFTIVGLKSWIHKLALSVVLSVIYYIVFVRYGGMAFPKGILF